MNAREFVVLEREISMLEWLKERMEEELSIDHRDYLRGYATLRGAMKAWIEELEKTIDQLKSLLNE